MQKFKQQGHTPIIMVKSSANIEKSSIENETQVQQINFLYSFRPIYYFSRIFGLMPFSIIYDSNGEIKQSKITIVDGIWFLISMFIYSLHLYLTLLKFSNQTTPTTFVMILGNTFLLMIVMYGAGAVAMGMCNRFKYIKIAKNFTVFDRQASFSF